MGLWWDLVESSTWKPSSVQLVGARYHEGGTDGTAERQVLLAHSSVSPVSALLITLLVPVPLKRSLCTQMFHVLF